MPSLWLGQRNERSFDNGARRLPETTQRPCANIEFVAQHNSARNFANATQRCTVATRSLWVEPLVGIWRRAVAIGAAAAVVTQHKCSGGSASWLARAGAGAAANSPAGVFWAPLSPLTWLAPNIA